MTRERLELVVEREAVAGLDLDGGGAVGRELTNSRHASSKSSSSLRSRRSRTDAWMPPPRRAISM